MTKFIRSDLGQDVLYDNVPTHIGCAEVPAQEDAEDAVDDFPISDDPSTGWRWRSIPVQLRNV